MRKKRLIYILGALLLPVLAGTVIRRAPKPVPNWSQCSCSGVPLYGRVKIVKDHADFHVKIVKDHEHLRVRKVKDHASRCGLWLFVEDHEDFRVRFVEDHEDFRIRYVDDHAGVHFFYRGK